MQRLYCRCPNTKLQPNPSLHRLRFYSWQLGRKETRNVKTGSRHCGVCFGLLKSLPAVASQGDQGQILGALVPVKEAHVECSLFSSLFTCDFRSHSLNSPPSALPVFNPHIRHALDLIPFKMPFFELGLPKTIMATSPLWHMLVVCWEKCHSNKKEPAIINVAELDNIVFCPARCKFRLPGCRRE